MQPVGRCDTAIPPSGQLRAAISMRGRWMDMHHTRRNILGRRLGEDARYKIFDWIQRRVTRVQRIDLVIKHPTGDDGFNVLPLLTSVFAMGAQCVPLPQYIQHMHHCHMPFSNAGRERRSTRPPSVMKAFHVTPHPQNTSRSSVRSCRVTPSCDVSDACVSLPLILVSWHRSYVQVHGVIIRSSVSAHLTWTGG